MRHHPHCPPRGVAHHTRVAGHFGELLQGRLGPDGPVALITLPCPALAVRATWKPGPGLGLWQGARPVLSGTRLRQLFATLGLGRARGRLRLRADMPPGGGAGASTAALLATARCLSGGALSPEAEAALCLSLEGATDPLMLARPERTLWAPRRAVALGSLPPLPAIDVVGGFAGAGRPTDPVDMRFADIDDLVADWRRTATRAGFAALASESARRNHALRGGPDPAPVQAAGRRLGALGVVAAHTGAALGLIFAPGTVPPDTGQTLRALGLFGVVRFRAGGAA
ncbi:threonine kinase [Rhodovulum bhavnagarense]|uniref:Threonine kinase n=1 Tax=Rhodovulum bhavnagarense TaxID=992286 RepID=A0A4R2RP98_9RHOB|nr:propanediol utilization protein [Rhodovulum bhavnagarense]TCP61651.1 threonine kinase [Rhodovulum bhavnagarense]